MTAESSYATTREGAAYEREQLTVALGLDVDELFVDMDARGISVAAMRRELLIRTNGVVDLPHDQVTLLLETARVSGKKSRVLERQVQRDDAYLSRMLGEPFKDFLRQMPAEATPPIVVRAVRQRVADLRIGPARVSRVMDMHRKQVILTSGTRTRVPRRTKSPVRIQRRSLPKKRESYEVQIRPGSSEWCDAIISHLAAVLGGSPEMFIREALATAISKGADEREAFEQVAKRLAARGARKWLTGKDIQTIAAANGWLSDGDTSRATRPQPYLHVVSGGLPTLGKRH